METATKKIQFSNKSNKISSIKEESCFISDQHQINSFVSDIFGILNIII
jgi:hypothetical protein